MNAAQKVSGWLAQVRSASAAAWVARSVIAVAGGTALVVPALQSWDQADLVMIIGTPMLIASMVLPDSLAPLAFLAVVSGGWLLSAPNDLTVALVVTGIALLVVHLACAFAGQLPSYAQVRRRALGRWMAPAAIASLIGPVVAIVAAAVRHAELQGSLLVTVAAVAAVTAVVWYASGQSLKDR